MVREAAARCAVNTGSGVGCKDPAWECAQKWVAHARFYKIQSAIDDVQASMEDGANANDRLPRLCEQCGLPMKYVGKLPRSGEKPQIMVYRCDTCRRIESDKMD